MAFNPGPITPNIAPQLMLQGAQAQGQMYAGLGKSIGQGIQGWMEQREKAKEAEGYAKNAEKFIRDRAGQFGFKTGSPEGEDEMEAFLTRGPNETAVSFAKRLDGFINQSITGAKMEQVAGEIQKAKMENEALKQQIAAFARKEEESKRFDVFRQNAIQLAKGVGTGVYSKEFQDNPFVKTVGQAGAAGLPVSGDDVLRFVGQQQAVAAKPVGLDVEKVRFEKDGEAWERAINKRTGEVVSEGPVHRPVLTPTEEAEKASRVGMETLALDRIKEAKAASDESDRIIPRVRTAISLLKDPEVQTGAGQGFILKAKQIGGTLGLAVGPEVQKAEQLQSLLGENMMSTILQLTKGAVSNKEMELFDNYSASFGKTNAGNVRILEMALAARERSRKERALINQWQDEGITASKIARKLDQWRDENSVIKPSDLSGSGGFGFDSVKPQRR